MVAPIGFGDRIQDGFTCKKCIQLYAVKIPISRTYKRWQRPRMASVTPQPPGLSPRKAPKPSKLQMTTAEILAPGWDSLGDSFKKELTEVGISPVIKTAEHPQREPFPIAHTGS